MSITGVAGERIYYDRGTVLDQLGLFHEPVRGLGRAITVLSRPLTIARIPAPQTKPANQVRLAQCITTLGRDLWFLDRTFPAAYLAELVESSYQRAFASLSKARQTAIRASDRSVNRSGA
jgi:hypothetical protein